MNLLLQSVAYFYIHLHIYLFIRLHLFVSMQPFLESSTCAVYSRWPPYEIGHSAEIPRVWNIQKDSFSSKVKDTSALTAYATSTQIQRWIYFIYVIYIYNLVRTLRRKSSPRQWEAWFSTFFWLFF